MRKLSSPAMAARRRAAVTLTLAVIVSGVVALAQAPVPPPGPPPLTQPSVPVLPGMPQPLVSVPLTVATPLATTVPVPTPLPTPSVRTFNCSCFTAASATEWAGTVQAQSYTAAVSTASGACVVYMTRTPQSPFMQPGQSPGLQTSPTQPQGTSATESATTATQPPGTESTGSTGSSASALKSEPSLTGQTFCNLCACN
jgi:hypothetical protein